MAILTVQSCSRDDNNQNASPMQSVSATRAIMERSRPNFFMVVPPSPETKASPRKAFGTASPVQRRRRLVKHARYYWLLLAESHLTRRLLGAMVGRIDALPLPSG